MLPIQISKRARLTPPSPIRRLARYAQEAEARGTSIFHLNIGQPDIETPKEFYAGLQRYQDPIVAYEVSQGNQRLREAWSRYMLDTVGLTCAPEQFLITTGASEALIFTFMITCDPGDEVLIFDPTYANYIGFAAISGVDLIPLVTRLEDDFCLPSIDAIEQRMTSRTRAILLCSPNNPTGTVYAREELEALIALCDKHNVFLVVDETYREFVYDGREPLSVFHIAPDNERLVVIDSLSKRFSLCGARIGTLITPNARVLEAALSLAQARLSVSSLAQVAAAEMLQSISRSYVEEVRAEYEARRNILIEEVNKIDGAVSFVPGGAFYTIVRLPIMNAEDFAQFLLTEFSYNQKSVFVAPAQGFYMSRERGHNKVRLASVLEQDQLQEAIDLLCKGLEAYQLARSGG